MNFIHFVDTATIESVLKNGIQPDDCYRGQGILVYPEKDMDFRAPNLDPEWIQMANDHTKTSYYEKWEVIGALGLRQEKKSVSTLKVELSDAHWPLKVFIDIQDAIAQKFGKLLDECGSSGIAYSSENTLTEVVNNIEIPQYVLEGSFMVHSETDLIELMELFQKSNGGIWGAHSFDCMVSSVIPAGSILEIVEG